MPLNAETTEIGSYQLFELLDLAKPLDHTTAYRSNHSNRRRDREGETISILFVLITFSDNFKEFCQKR
jgi:hypothetical protein